MYMKKIMIVVLMLGATFAASAQRHTPIRGGHGHYIRPRVSVGVGFGYPVYPYGYYSPYYGYPYGGPAYGYNYRPSGLNLQIQEIRNDYRHLIRDARHDKSVSRSDRRAKISSLKHDRDEAVIQAQKDYYNKLQQRRR
jgi:hypothetical protein